MCDPDRVACPKPLPGPGSGCALQGEEVNLPFRSPAGSFRDLLARPLTLSIQSHAAGPAPLWPGCVSRTTTKLECSLICRLWPIRRHSVLRDLATSSTKDSFC